MRVGEAVRRPALQFAGACLLYTLFAVYLTWPLVAHLGSTVYLVPPNPPGPGDLAGTIAHLRELVEGHHNPFLPGRVHDFNAPDGLPIRWALNLASFPSVLLLYALALAFGANAALGLFVLAGYVASGSAMFLLARRLTGSAGIGLIAGWAFAFYPFAVVKGEHPHFIHGWVFVLMIWRFIELMERPTSRNGVWAGLAAVLTFAWTQYFILIGGVAFWVLTLMALAVGAARRELRRHLVAHLPSIAIASGFVLVMRSILLQTGENSTLPGNTLLDVVSTAAKVPMYLVPPAHHPLGAFTTDYLNDHNLNAVEWTLYVGLTMISLALLGLGAAALGRVPRPLVPVAVISAGLAVAGFVFSLPPEQTIAGTTVKLPSWVIFEASPNWRLYTRFVIVVMLGVCLLAAIGMRALVEGRAPRARAALLAGVAAAVVFDLWDRPPQHTFEIETPGIYRTLRSEPAGIVAEYPLRSIVRVGHYLDLYYQDAHGHPVLNGYYAGPDEQRALRLASLDDSATAGRLATLGVRYVLVTPLELLPGVPAPGVPGKGLHLLRRDGPWALYRNDARPVPFVYGRALFGPPEGSPGQQYQWMGISPAELEVIAPCERCRGVLRFGAASFGRPRSLSITSSAGRRLFVGIVPTRERRISIPLAFSRRIVLRFGTKPGPQSIQEATGASDSRSVSIWVKEPVFRSAR